MLWRRLVASSGGADSVTVITDGLLYHFIAPASGLTVANAGSVSGNWNCEGIKVAGPTCVGGGLEIDTTDLDQLQFPGVPTAGTVGTICYWQRKPAGANNVGLTVGAHAGNSYSGYLVLPRTTDIFAAIGQGSGTPSSATRYQVEFTPTADWDLGLFFNDEEWVHIAVTFNIAPTTNNRPVDAWFNGLPHGNALGNGFLTSVGFASGARIGPGNWQLSSTINGTGAQFADIRVYDRQLSDVEIALIAAGNG